MKVQEVLNAVQAFAPFESQMSFDNAGLLVGSGVQDVQRVGVALDVTPGVLRQAVEQGVDCIVSHHPVIFSGLKAIPADNVVYMAITQGISIISAHTNLDAAQGGVNDLLANKLCLSNITAIGLPEEATPPMGRVGYLPAPMTDGEFADFVATALQSVVKYTPTQRMVHKVAVCGGSGAEFMYPAIQQGADALVTAEVKHHMFLEAQNCGFMLLDAGHYETEQPVVTPLVQKLGEMLSVPVTQLLQEAPVRYSERKNYET